MSYVLKRCAPMLQNMRVTTVPPVTRSRSSPHPENYKFTGTVFHEGEHFPESPAHPEQYKFLGTTYIPEPKKPHPELFKFIGTVYNEPRSISQEPEPEPSPEYYKFLGTVYQERALEGIRKQPEAKPQMDDRDSRPDRIGLSRNHPRRAIK
mmetsp:Transcript_29452/g.68272  ORF Transcript_29452/g.68272 Transcript_29452/m.68272 type:complete len:151 (-) Transcript_29452:96-548(-)|eukprot:CAMPEP_0114540948 /NCGR_PEP_ID=MMETSP0114-20121206/1044_1 /TAXON_ID=31324 /ORGANISM="Goniomonas sp, Strain m" /LENGTH=150 /DNA_ID=CAMNT_0001725153 /DNA_START=73 /DNA_END=525 /DNA_ORIENTATION=-